MSSILLLSRCSKYCDSAGEQVHLLQCCVLNFSYSDIFNKNKESVHKTLCVVIDAAESFSVPQMISSFYFSLLSNTVAVRDQKRWKKTIFPAPQIYLVATWRGDGQGETKQPNLSISNLIMWYRVTYQLHFLRAMSTFTSVGFWMQDFSLVVLEWRTCIVL